MNNLNETQSSISQNAEILSELQAPGVVRSSPTSGFRNRGGHSMSLPHSVEMGSYFGRTPMDSFDTQPDPRYPQTRLKGWSVENYEADLSANNDLFPPISAHNYDAQYYNNSSLMDMPSNLRHRYSTPIYRSHSRANSQESEDIYMTPQISFPYSLSNLESPPIFHDDYNPITSSTPDSPLNSSLDYRSINQEIPVIFHRGGGKRGGIRIDANGIQDLSLLLASSQNVPKSPLHVHNNSNRLSSRNSIHNSSSRIHHLSLSNNIRRTHSGSLPENEFNPIAMSKNHNQGRITRELAIPQEPSYVDYGNRNNTVTDDISNLLHVLLSISEKYDFSKLHTRMICNSKDLNPNSGTNARLCYDYLNTGVCKREQTTGVCHFRHLGPDNIDCVVDKIRNGKMPICLIRRHNSEYIVADMPSCNDYPGELNPFAAPDADLCLEYNLKGVCPNEQVGKCPYRHLADCHPERIALLYTYGQITEYEANAWLLSPCAPNDTNPFSSPSEKTCYDFVNTGVCKRTQKGQICRFHHYVSESKCSNRS